MYAVSIEIACNITVDGEPHDGISDDVKKGLIAGAFGLAGTLIPVVLSWSRDRDAASTRQRKIDEATKRIAFWEQWLKLSSQVESPDGQDCAQRVQKELAMLGDIIERDSLLAHTQSSKLQEKTSKFTEHVNVLPAWRRLCCFTGRSVRWPGFPVALLRGLLSFFLFLAISDL